MSSDEEQPPKMDGPFYDNDGINLLYDSNDDPSFLDGPFYDEAVVSIWFLHLYYRRFTVIWRPKEITRNEERWIYTPTLCERL